jgi:hypothetical protein
VSQSRRVYLVFKGGHTSCLLPSHFSEALNTQAGNTKGGNITVPLTSCLTGLD